MILYPALPTSATLPAAGVLCILFVSVALRPLEIRDVDVFWHLATGRWILQNHTIPFHDPFSHTASSVHWIDHEWLFQVLLRGIQRLGGISLLFAVKVCVYSAAFAIPAFFAWKRGGAAFPVVTALAVSLFTAMPFSEYRPVMFSMLFLAATIEGARRVAASSRFPLIWLPALFLVWANMHSTFAIGLAAIGAFAAVEVVRARGFAAVPRNLLFLLILCGLATLVNPYGVRLWEVPAKVAASDLFLSANNEWRPPDGSMEFWGFYVSVAVVIVAALVGRRRMVAADVLIAVVLGAASFKSRRIIPYFAVAALPVIWAGVVNCGGISMLKGLPRIVTVGVAALSVFAGTLWSAAVMRNREIIVSTQDGLPFLNGAFPDVCAETLRKAATSGNLFNDYNHGGFLHYTAGPSWKVYMDGRNDLFGESLTRKYTGIALAQGNWARDLDNASVDAAILSYDICMMRPENLALALAGIPNQWALVEFDDGGMLFVRRATVPNNWISSHEYKAVHPMLMFEEHDLSNPPVLGTFISELKRRTSEGRCRVAEILLAQALVSSGRIQEAEKIIVQTETLYGSDDLMTAVRMSMGERNRRNF